MTRSRANAVARFLGQNQISARQLAALIETPARTVQDWAAGRSSVPGAVLVLLRSIESGEPPIVSCRCGPRCTCTFRIAR